MSQAWADHLDLLIRARTPILWIRSQEEERIAALLSDAAKRLGNRALARWDFIENGQDICHQDTEVLRSPHGSLHDDDPGCALCNGCGSRLCDLNQMRDRQRCARDAERRLGYDICDI